MTAVRNAEAYALKHRERAKAFWKLHLDVRAMEHWTYAASEYLYLVRHRRGKRKKFFAGLAATCLRYANALARGESIAPDGSLRREKGEKASPKVKPSKPRNPSRCCKAPLAYETFAGVFLLTREIDGVTKYRCQCTKCGRTYDVTRRPVVA